MRDNSGSGKGTTASSKGRGFGYVSAIVGVVLAALMLWAISEAYSRDMLGGSAALQFWTIATLWAALAVGLLLLAHGISVIRRGRASPVLGIALAIAFVGVVIGAMQIGSASKDVPVSGQIPAA